MQKSVRPAASVQRRDASSEVSRVLRSFGSPLDAETRMRMETRFGHDFSRVRVHTDDHAAESARMLEASAYTVGSHVAFGEGRFEPHTRGGQELIAHELAHVVQQSNTGAAMAGEPLAMSAAGDPFERSASDAAHAMGAGHPIPALAGGMPPMLQRQPLKPEEQATKALEGGPKTDKGEFGKSKTRRAKIDKAKTAITRVTIPVQQNNKGVRGLTSRDFQSEFRKCPTSRSEAGLPSAFLCATEQITAPKVASDDQAALDTNVRVVFQGGATSGKAFVSQADLPWELTTAGFLDIDAIDSKMLTPYDNHEKGHRTIAVDILQRLAPMLQADLDAALPTKAKPLTKSGGGWGQQAVNAIIATIDKITKRYETWFAELADRADAAWDKQEAKTLSSIATAVKAKQQRSGGVPPVKD